jgi:hypothetical protein
MRKATRFGALATVVSMGALVLGAGSAMAAAPSAVAPYTCVGGSIPSGTYASITVAGMCDVEHHAEITVVGNINVAAGAMFDAQSVPAMITVGRNVTAAEGALLGLGCQPRERTDPKNSAHECVAPFEDDWSTITVHGNVTATAAHTVLLNGITVHGNVTLTDGGAWIPWSIKNNEIHGNLTVSGQTVEWLGVMFNKIDRNATLTNITLTEDHPGASMMVYVVRNTVGRNLNCSGLVEGVSPGFVPTLLNTVGRNANGQCAAVAY